jgi:hypothetical protein
VISFRVGIVDAPLVKEFEDEFETDDLIRLPNYRFYLKVMINGMPSKAFSASTLTPVKEPLVIGRSPLSGLQSSGKGAQRTPNQMFAFSQQIDDPSHPTRDRSFAIATLKNVVCIRSLLARHDILSEEFDRQLRRRLERR